MRLATIRTEQGPRAVARTEGPWVLTEYSDVRALLAAEDGLPQARAAAEGGGQEVVDPRFLAPIHRPEKILGSGINYDSHAEEDSGAFMPKVPFFFSKLPSAVVGPGDAIILPRKGLGVDYEVELAVVIGSRARNVTIDEAISCIAGYTLMNDVSSREIQFVEEQPGDRQITLGKSLDSFAPLGPVVVLTDEVPDPTALRVQAVVNGELRQDESIALLRFGPAELVSFASSLVTLEPGDVISTGTPGGCGSFMDPPRYLQPGDVVTVREATTIGEITNPVVAGEGYDSLPGWRTPWERAA